MSRSFLSGSSGPAAPRGHRAYAVGDIHGRADLLDQLLGRIEVDNRGRPKAKVTIVFLGDLVDRGPQSRDVVERLRRYRPAFARTVFLAGNHEEVLLRILAGEGDLIVDWLKFGGVECARSYGVDAGELRRMPAAQAVERLRRAIPEEHVAFLSAFADSASFGRYLFVHAGIRPGVPLANQLKTDLRWIRRPFLDDDSDHGVVVVHGHSISETVEVRHNRIGLDTGAYRSGVLTALGVEGNERWFVQTGAAVEQEAGGGRVAQLARAH